MYEIHRICYVTIRRNHIVFFIGIIIVSGFLTFFIPSNFVYAESDSIFSSWPEISNPSENHVMILDFQLTENEPVLVFDIDVLNDFDISETYDLVIQIEDENRNFVPHLTISQTYSDYTLIKGTLSQGENLFIHVNLPVEFPKSGKYFVNLGLWNNFDEKIPISNYLREEIYVDLISNKISTSLQNTQIIKPNINSSISDDSFLITLDENWNLDLFFQYLNVVLVIFIVVITGFSIVKSYMKISLGVFSKFKFISSNKEKNLQIIAIMSLILIPIGSANNYFCEESHCNERSFYDHFLQPTLFAAGFSIALSILAMALGIIAVMAGTVGMSSGSFEPYVVGLLGLLPWIVFWRIEKYSIEASRWRFLYYGIILSSISYLGYMVLPYPLTPM